MEKVDDLKPTPRISPAIKKNNVRQLEYMSKDMANLANRMRPLNPSNPSHTDNLGSAVVEASFFVNAFGLAAQAFKNMVTDLNKEGSEGPRGDVLFYLFEEANKFEQEIKEKEEEK